MGIEAGHDIAGRSTVAVIDANPQHRDQVASALLSFYRVADYPDVETAIGMTRARPSVLLVDESARPATATPLIRTLRQESLFHGVPIIICRVPGRPADRKVPGGDAQPDALLDKPFRRSELINAISGVLNRTVEASWSDLPPRPQAGLRATLKTFNGIADLIEKGEPLSYEELDASCAPLIDAVAHSEHKHILAAIRGHDNYSYVHSMRVATLLTLFGQTIGLKDEALVIMAVGGLIHDIGKMGIPHEILNKPGPLTPDEMARMRTHVAKTVEHLRRHSDVPKGVLTIAEQHHEKLDGSGYPHGLKAAKLNDLARMAAIVDVFAAMTDRRPYRPPVSPEQALAVMTEDMAGQLDNRLMKMFRTMLLDAVTQDWT